MQQLDPIYVDLTQSSAEWLSLRRELAAGRLEGTHDMPVAIVLEDGTPYAQSGKLAFSEVSVDPTTGSFALRVVVPNPEHILLPGMYVRAIVGTGTRQSGLLVPQQGIARDPKGHTSAMVVGQDGKVEVRTVRVSQAIGDKWLVEEGLAAGDKVIVEGLQKVQPGALVQPTEAGAPPPVGSPRSSRSLSVMAHFFIDRPIFAWVIAIIIMLAGGLAITQLPISMYPNIAPPSVTISANYPGASAKVVQDAVTQIIERNMKGLDGLIYMSATSDASGNASITLTFESGTDPDIAQVQVQNKLQLAMPSLPQEVQRQGVNVTKSRSGFLMVIAFVSKDGSMTRDDISDYVGANLVDPLSRVPGVGTVQLFGSPYAMRIWLDPNKLETYGLAVGDIISAVRAQNAQVTIGQLGGAPSVEGQQLNATISAQERLQTPEQFRDIVLRSNPDGSALKLGDVARVEIGAETYEFVSRYNGQPASGVAISLATGANALETAAGVELALDGLRQYFPTGLQAVVPFDTTPFVRMSIKGVITTLVEAIVLVFLVIYLFLQNFRATLIPTIAVPVVLLGTMGVLAALGFSINMLTMFAMVLAIGLLVDDAIVVVENVERVMREEGLSPVEATRKSMREITGALVGIGMVLAAVFVPMAFMPGSIGVIYRQFSATIVSAMSLSVLVAIVLTPALCATMLKPVRKGEHHAETGFFGWFNRTFERSSATLSARRTRHPGAQRPLHARVRRPGRPDGRAVRAAPERVPAPGRSRNPARADHRSGRRDTAAHPAVAGKGGAAFPRG